MKYWKQKSFVGVIRGSFFFKQERKHETRVEQPSLAIPLAARLNYRSTRSYVPLFLSASRQG
jgi:hypothetical protein